MFASRPPPLTWKDAVRLYEERLHELVDSCADHQRHDPEVFLWNARRALEAMCHLLLTVQRKEPSRVDRASNDGSLDGMIKRLTNERVLDREQAPRFDLARQHTNLGVHIQQPEREEYDAAVEDTAHVLPGLLDWLYDESIAAPYLKGREGLPIQAIRDGGREGPSLKEAAVVARRELDLAERTAARLESDLERHQERLAERETRWWRWLWRVGIAGAAGLVVGACAGVFSAPVFFEPSGAVALTGDVTGAADVGKTTGKDAAKAGEAAGTAALASIAAPAAECGTGMTLVPARAGMRIGQPEGGRTNWPAPSRSRLDAVDVPSFCLDVAPRTRAEVTTGYDTAAVGRCERNQPASERPEARTCLTRDEAEAWCQAAVPGGHLPGILEWESAARAAIPALHLPVHEWSGERFPPKPFLRADPAWPNGDGMWVGRIPAGRAPTSPDGHVLLGWNQQPPENRHVERTFRCAAPAL